MKLLVYIGCAQQAYLAYLKAAHPTWDIRAVSPTQGKTWIEEGHPGFMGFLQEVDIVVGRTDRQPLAGHLRPEVTQVHIPTFGFSGHQPDTVMVEGLPSPLSRGNAQSRIVAAGWLSGLTQAQTQARFTADHYASLGYFQRRDKELARLHRVYDPLGMDVAGLVQRWWDRPGFMHYPVHPQVAFFFDLIRLGMEQAGFAPEVDEPRLDAAREALPDYLADGLHWPVYPEIAAHHGIAATPALWRSSAAKGPGESFDLGQMIARSYALYDGQPDSYRSALTDALGGPKRVALHAGLHPQSHAEG